MKFTKEEIGKKLKEANPGKFDSFSDTQLANFYVEAKPQAKGIVLEDTTVGGIAKGFGKSAASTVKETAGLGERLLGTLGKAVLPKAVERAIGIENAPVLSDMFKQQAPQTGAELLQKQIEQSTNIPEGALTEARTPEQKIGKFGGDLLQFALTPQSKLTGAGRALQSIPKVQQAGKLTQFAARIAPQVATDVGVATAQTGDVRQGALAGGVSAAFPAAGALIRGVKSSVPKRPISPIIEDIIPTRQGIKEGQITKALDLTAGDVSNIKSSTGNSVGDWIAKKGAIGETKEQTLEKVSDIFDTNYKAVRDEISKVSKNYTPNVVPRVNQSLSKISDELDGVIGLEATKQEIDNLLAQQSYSLSDIQRVKELIDSNYNLYKATGDVREGQVKQGLDRVRKELKKFIEDEVYKTTGADIKALNNDVATAKNILELTEKRSTRDLTRANFSLSDITTLVAGSLASPALGIGALFAKRVADSPAFRLRLAQWLNTLDDAAREKAIKEIASGTVPSGLPKILKNLIKQTPKVAPAAVKAGVASED